MAAPSFGPSCSILNLCTSFTVIMYNSNLANLCPMQALRSFGQTFALRPTWHHGPTEGWQRSGRCAFDRCLSTTSPAGTFPGQKSFRGCWTCCDPHAQQLNPWGFHTRLLLCRPEDSIACNIESNLKPGDVCWFRKMQGSFFDSQSDRPSGTSSCPAPSRPSSPLARSQCRSPHRASPASLGWPQGGGQGRLQLMLLSRSPP